MNRLVSLVHNFGFAIEQRRYFPNRNNVGDKRHDSRLHSGVLRDFQNRAKYDITHSDHCPRELHLGSDKRNVS